MDSKKSIDRTVFGRTRRDTCKLVALDFMERNKLHIARQIIKSIQIVLSSGSKNQSFLVEMYLYGHTDGFAMALELVLSGELNLQEMNVSQETEKNES